MTLWHWTFSVTFRSADGGLAMANPIHAVPGAWLLTWLGQVMPVFFLAGGYVNLLGWQRTRASGRCSWHFVRARLRRLLVPTSVWAAVWLVAELAALALGGEHRWIWEWFPGYLAPLWFLAAYGLLIVAVPVTAAWHLRRGGFALAVLAVLIATGSVLAARTGHAVAVWATMGLVWVFCHQLGYAWLTYDLGHRPLTHRLACAAAGLGVLVALTTWGGLPASMVATASDDRSNIFPTNATVAALALLQLGLLATATPALERVLLRPSVWKPVVAVNVVALTVFLWHMSAYLVVVWVYEHLGETLLAEPTARWWSQRWLWLFAPAVVLAGFVAVFARFETPALGFGGRRRGPPGRLRNGQPGEPA